MAYSPSSTPYSIRMLWAELLVLFLENPRVLVKRQNKVGADHEIMGSRPRQEEQRQRREGCGYRYRVTGNDPWDERFTRLGLGQAGGFRSVFQPRHPRPDGLPQL